MCILGDGSRMVERFDATHDNLALRMMVSRFRKTGMTQVAIERGDGPLVQVLIDAGLTVFVVPPRQIKSLTARQATRATVSTRTSSRTRCGPTVTDDGRCAKITRKPKRYG